MSISQLISEVQQGLQEAEATVSHAVDGAAATVMTWEDKAKAGLAQFDAQIQALSEQRARLVSIHSAISALDAATQETAAKLFNL